MKSSTVFSNVGLARLNCENAKRNCPPKRQVLGQHACIHPPTLAPASPLGSAGVLCCCCCLHHRWPASCCQAASTAGSGLSLVKCICVTVACSAGASDAHFAPLWAPYPTGSGVEPREALHGGCTSCAAAGRAKDHSHALGPEDAMSWKACCAWGTGRRHMRAAAMTTPTTSSSR